MYLEDLGLNPDDTKKLMKAVGTKFGTKTSDGFAVPLPKKRESTATISAIVSPTHPQPPISQPLPQPSQPKTSVQQRHQSLPASTTEYGYVNAVPLHKPRKQTDNSYTPATATTTTTITSPNYHTIDTAITTTSTTNPDLVDLLHSPRPPSANHVHIAHYVQTTVPQHKQLALSSPSNLTTLAGSDMQANTTYHPIALHTREDDPEKPTTEIIELPKTETRPRHQRSKSHTLPPSQESLWYSSAMANAKTATTTTQPANYVNHSGTLDIDHVPPKKGVTFQIGDEDDVDDATDHERLQRWLHGLHLDQFYKIFAGEGITSFRYNLSQCIKFAGQGYECVTLLCSTTRTSKNWGCSNSWTESVSSTPSSLLVKLITIKHAINALIVFAQGELPSSSTWAHPRHHHHHHQLLPRRHHPHPPLTPHHYQLPRHFHQCHQHPCRSGMLVGIWLCLLIEKYSINNNGGVMMSNKC